MKAFSKFEVINYLDNNIKNWTFDGGSIKREFSFENFVEAFSFMTAVAMEAEKLEHHPDWSNAYNKVIISLSTHSEKGVTQNDFDLATKIDGIYNA